MRIEISKDSMVKLETNFNAVVLYMSDDVAREIHDRMEKRYFQEDFLNFLKVQHEDFEIGDSAAFVVWNLLWTSYQKHQDMNVAQWDTFEAVLQAVWEHCGGFSCCSCGKKLLGSLPVADCNGNCFCEYCADAQTDLCEECGERHLKSELTYVEDGVGYCEHCKADNIACCVSCGKEFLISEMEKDCDGDYWCKECADNLDDCAGCNRLFPKEDLHNHGSYKLCDECEKQAR